VRRKVSKALNRALAPLAGSFFGGVISAAATLFVCALFPDADWTNTFSVMGILTLAGAVIGAMVGAVVSDEIVSMRRQKFACLRHPAPIGLRRGCVADRRSRHSNAPGFARRVTDPKAPRLRLVHNRKPLEFPANLLRKSSATGLKTPTEDKSAWF
jgi:hypothetical protein